MASTSQLPPASTRQHNFEQAVAYALHLWPALTLSVANHWGGPDSAEKRDWFAGAIVELFPEFTDAAAAGPPDSSTSSSNNAGPDEADTEDVETVLLQVMVDEFEVNVDDDSALEVAQQIVRARTQCAAGQFDETNALAERFGKSRGSKVAPLFQKAEDPNQDTDEEPDDDSDDDDDDDGSDVDMGDAPPPKEKEEPQVDEDGFTMVTKKKR
ncbi:Pre-rRNA-processing TSR2 [Cordyceps militaris]|uniref:Pre-rRNA-processing TSR2 n=1 Tax=Cordyceps militaris TaxID=73501 RepID=A0A2H4S733_CORMI|nr:Pre-rRNA-processing TSR2 [Cordyceps militaris]